MIYIKHLRHNEKIKMQAAETIDEKRAVMLPHIVVGDWCAMPMARGMGKGGRPEPTEFVRLMRQWYGRTTGAFSEGIYSFARQGRTARAPGTLYYRYLGQEVDSLLSQSEILPEYAGLFDAALEMWEQGLARYRDTQFWSYHILHGDLHLGNVVRYRGQLRLIDWENLRSGPKEMELAFYLCWDHFRRSDYPYLVSRIPEEAAVFREEGLINEWEQERILHCLIPLWMLLLVVYLNNGSLLFADERKRACEKVLPQYRKLILREVDADGKA